MDKHIGSHSRVEVEISIFSQLGLYNIIENFDDVLHGMIEKHTNSIIQQLQITFDEEDSIILFCEGTPSIECSADFQNFVEDMKLFCAEIAHTYPEREMRGQIAVEEIGEDAKEGTFIYIASEAGSAFCYTKELSEESEPGIIFDEPTKTALPIPGAYDFEIVLDDSDD